jgi:hypothetical protein
MHFSVSTWQGISAITALFAAGFWFAAAIHPAPAGGGPSFYAPSDKNHPLWEQLRRRGALVARGLRFNQFAAALTGLSALAQFFSWYIGRP